MISKSTFSYCSFGPVKLQERRKRSTLRFGGFVVRLSMGKSRVPKSDRQKADFRRQKEVRRQSEKDRSAHEALRGKKMATLSSLSRELPTEDELFNFGDILSAEPSDRSAAIMAAGLVEQALYVAATSRMADPGPAIRNTWFEDANAPFATFAAKIKLGRALGIYGPKMDKTLCRIKDVRNVFAHRSTPIDFTHPSVEAAVMKMNSQPMTGSTPVRTRYCAICLATTKLLIKDAFEQGGKEIALSFP